MQTFQEILLALAHFWEKQGCIVHQGYDLEVGAGTFNPATFLRCLGKEPYRAAYIEPSRRPSDGRYGENPIRFQHYFQFQVILKPSPKDILDLYLKSLEAIGFDLSKHDIRFVHDDWESPTLGASGLGWEVWMDGMEVTQFTYFQNAGGEELNPITGEITYGIERLSTFLQGVDSTFALKWSGDVTYGDIYKRNEFEWSHYNFTDADVDMWHRHFEDFEKEAKRLIERKLPLPAYDFVMKASHAFNMLDARGAISVSERAGYIGRIRDLAKGSASLYIKSREEQGFPLQDRFKTFQEETSVLLPTIHEKLLHPKEGVKDDFLLEVGVEELPSSFVPVGIRGLEEAIRAFLEGHKIPYKKLSSYATPRRLAVLVEDVSLEKQEEIIEKRGPSVEKGFDSFGNPLPALTGFFKSAGIDPLPLANIRRNDNPQVSVQKQNDQEYVFVTKKHPKTSLARLLQEAIPSLILSIDFPKKMRWGNGTISFARPIRTLVALLGEDIIPIQMGDVVSGKLTYGHRQLSNALFEIKKPKNYLDDMRAHFVLADIKEREATINTQLSKIEKELDGTACEKEKVVKQVVNLVEWPSLTYADFDPSYLKAPKEILIAEMVEHQKYFPIQDKNGALKNFFVITANNTPSDLIRKGNQKVLSSRLKDGTFLFQQDLNIPLEAFNEKLKNVTYLKGLGSLFDKVERLKKHAKVLQEYLNVSDVASVEIAASLSKMDLTSHVVYEFPELQGTMGKIYALHAGVSKEVAESIEESWMPKGENTPLPKTATGTILSLADKLDNLISCFGMNLKPSSSSDPYALRRQALGMIRILIDGKFSLPLQEVLQKTVGHFPKLVLSKEETAHEISQFIQNRIRTVFQDLGLTKDEIEASLSSGFNDIYDAYRRIIALSVFRKEGADFLSLLEVYKRAKGQIPAGNLLPLSKELLVEPAEKALFQSFETAEKKVQETIKAQDYSSSYTHLARLKDPLATLFTEVKILDDDPKKRQNRLALLQRVFALFGKLVDFSKIQTL